MLLCCVDDYARYTWVKFLRGKSDNEKVLQKRPNDDGILDDDLNQKNTDVPLVVPKDNNINENINNSQPFTNSNETLESLKESAPSTRV